MSLSDVTATAPNLADAYHQLGVYAGRILKEKNRPIFRWFS
jgi:hypothetical protein